MHLKLNPTGVQIHDLWIKKSCTARFMPLRHSALVLTTEPSDFPFAREIKARQGNVATWTLHAKPQLKASLGDMKLQYFTTGWAGVQWHEVYCHDLEVMSLNPGQVKLGVHCNSVLSHPWTKISSFSLWKHCYCPLQTKILISSFNS